MENSWIFCSSSLKIQFGIDRDKQQKRDQNEHIQNLE